MGPSSSPSSTPPHQLAWTVVNLSTVPLWLAMILAPRSGLTRWLMDRVAPLYGALAAFYGVALVAGAAGSEERVDFFRLESVSRAFQNPNAMLAGWTHYIAFDLFVGREIWERSLAEGAPARLSLLLTWWAGPVGLGLHLLRGRLPAALR